MQVSSASVKTIPACALIHAAPCFPSEPIPVNTTPSVRWRKVSAADRNNTSTDGRCGISNGRASRCVNTFPPPSRSAQVLAGRGKHRATRLDRLSCWYNAETALDTLAAVDLLDRFVADFKDLFRGQLSRFSTKSIAPIP